MTVNQGLDGLPPWTAVSDTGTSEHGPGPVVPLASLTEETQGSASDCLSQITSLLSFRARTKRRLLEQRRYCS